MMIEIFGYIGGFLTTVGMVPQAYKLFKLKSAKEISWGFSVTLFMGIGFWLAYGCMLGLPAIIIANAISLILSGLILYAKLKWGMK